MQLLLVLRFQHLISYLSLSLCIFNSFPFFFILVTFSLSLSFILLFCIVSSCSFYTYSSLIFAFSASPSSASLSSFVPPLPPSLSSRLLLIFSLLLLSLFHFIFFYVRSILKSEPRLQQNRPSWCTTCLRAGHSKNVPYPATATTKSIFGEIHQSITHLSRFKLGIWYRIWHRS